MVRSYSLAGLALAALLATGFVVSAGPGKGEGRGKRGACDKASKQSNVSAEDEKNTAQPPARQPGQRRPGQRQPGQRPGGFGRGGQPGQVLPAFLQRRLNLTDEQKKQVEALQKEIDARLAKILTAEQKKSLQEMRERGGRGGRFGGRPGGEGGRRGGGRPDRRPGGDRPPDRPPQ